MQSQIVFLKSGANFLTLCSHLLGEAVVSLEVVFLLDVTCDIAYSVLVLSGYTQLVERAGSILQMNEALDVRLKFLVVIVEYKLITSLIQTTQTFDTFACAQAEGNPEAVRILAPLRLRYFTPAELLRLFYFDLSPIDQHQSPVPETFVWPNNITTKTKYRLIGNSVNVKVVTALINFLFKV
jgi:tRNA (cytosine38-C5)-methyltransferase